MFWIDPESIRWLSSTWFPQLEYIYLPECPRLNAWTEELASAVFDLSRSRNIGKYRKLAKYWQITPRAEQMAWTGGFLSFPERSFHLATFFKKIIDGELWFICGTLLFFLPMCEILILVLTIYLSLSASEEEWSSNFNWLAQIPNFYHFFRAPPKRPLCLEWNYI